MFMQCRRLWLQQQIRPSLVISRHLRTVPNLSILNSRQRLLDALTRPDSPENTDNIRPIYAYRHLRLVDKAALAQVPVETFFHLFARAASHELSSTANSLARDFLELCPKEQLLPSLQRLLDMPTVSLLGVNTLLLVLRAMRSCPGGLESFTDDHITALARGFAEARVEAPVAHRTFVQALSPELLSRLEAMPLPQGHDAATYTPPPIVQTAFKYLVKLLPVADHHQDALKLFQFLVNSGNIPPEAVQTLPGIDDFASIIRTSLVRACAYWHWRPLAVEFLRPLLETRPSESTISLTIDTIHACLISPEQQDLAACRTLITLVHAHQPVPRGVIRQYYDAAFEIDAAQDAYIVYAFTKTPEVLEAEEYPAPRGRVLPWLMAHLLKEHSVLAKELGNDILSSNIPVAFEARVQIVARLSSQGHAVLARSLWNKWAAGRDRASFVGHPQLLLRLVSLFEHLVRRWEDALKQNPDNEPLESLIASGREFGASVLESFLEVHQPLENASHADLSALARVYFINGRFMDGFQTLRTMLDQRHMPDIHDVNVILSAIAIHDPREAASVLDRMQARGLEPDHVSYGTVMHNAFVYGDSELANEMVVRISQLKDRELSYKSIVSLVRASLAPGTGRHYGKLQSVWRILQAVDKTTILKSPHLGNFLINAALRAEMPVMAFKFWDYICRERTLWTDLQQVELRRMILRKLEKHRRAGWLKERSTRAMVGMLRKEQNK
ncbi:Golgi reassembly stacking protein 2 [Mycena chlorophos]|uniref:Golgi reassembly stacking protein 2 n=1 Tax=Mycena chlorophos TaxID=658473 RepID=A0A8H6S2V6_MYCCL|nr:Golgi reassembly stacking protein 2 [Mycena chlorophos]